MTGPATMTGGCQCGRIRYSAQVTSDEAYLCHCGMCRRATGGIAAALKGMQPGEVSWTTREPDRYRSSPIAFRGFCSACGTPLTFEYADGGGMDLTVGSFDDPGYFRPTANWAAETILPAWQDTSHLRTVRLADSPDTRDRWIAACGRMPD